MKKYVLSISLVLLTSANAFAGGIFCRECPAENDKCIPICAENSGSKCTNESVLMMVLKPKVETAAAACCSWGPIPNCMKGC